MSAERTPILVDEIAAAFGGKVKDILPPMSEIPDNFKHNRGEARLWRDWQSDWFYSGLKRYPVPKTGIDLGLAMMNLQCVQGSFSPSHEHKAAGVAYLASLWFERPDGDPIARKRPS